MEQNREVRMRVKDLMKKEVLTVQTDDAVEDVLDALVGKHIHGAPVIDDAGELVGVVSLLDVYFGTMTRLEREGGEFRKMAGNALKVGDIMTSPAVSIGERANIPDLCDMMHKLRLHRVPVVRKKKVIGMVTSLDICAAVARGDSFD
jgi:CBS domain-containing protein